MAAILLLLGRIYSLRLLVGPDFVTMMQDAPSHYSKVSRCGPLLVMVQFCLFAKRYFHSEVADMAEISQPTMSHNVTDG